MPFTALILLFSYNQMIDDFSKRKFFWGPLWGLPRKAIFYMAQIFTIWLFSTIFPILIFFQDVVNRILREVFLPETNLVEQFENFG